MPKRLSVALVLVLAGLAIPSASGYYHFVRYLSRTGPFVPVLQKFDLNSLPNRTVNFYLTDQVYGLPLAPNDSVSGVISQILLAARTWSDVPTSALKLAFGGVHPAAVPVNGPGIDVVFTDDMPPGLCGQGGPVQVMDTAGGPTGPFAPIHRSVVMLPRNLCGNTSFSESFFQTATHELGHAVGLQHTFTSSAMSTQVTRSTSKAQPLTADDRAGLSLLYPAPGFLLSTGSIAGRVTLGGQGVAMASVVAIRPGGDAISTLTHPDGSYRIDGIPPGQYYVYAHPLPPAFEVEASPGNVVAPVGTDGRPFAFGASFDTQFFPGTREPGFALSVVAGAVIENVSFQVQARARPAIYAVQTYGFFGQVTTKPPTLNRAAGRGTFVAAGVGLQTAGNAPVAGLTVTPIGGAASLAPGSVRTYPFASSYLQLDMTFNPFAPEGPQHLIFGAGNDIYVLPAAFRIVSKAPPVVQSVQAAGDSGSSRQVLISGANFSTDTDILFDGLPAGVRAVEDGGARALAVLPPGPAGHRANVVALNSDGQSSLYVQGNSPAQYSFDAGDTGPVSVVPAALAAGSEAMVEVIAPGAAFAEGAALVGFSSGDIVVRRIWVAGPTRLLVNVSIAGSAQPGQTTITVTNGLQVWTVPFGFTIQAANPRQLNVVAGGEAAPATVAFASAQPGGQATLLVQNLPAGVAPGSVLITLNDQPAQVTGVGGGQVNFVIPAGLPPGPAVLRLRVGNDVAPPIAFGIDPPPPAVVSVSANGAAVDAARPVRAGDQVTLTVSGLTADDYTGVITRSRIAVNVAGVEHQILQVTNGLPGGLYQVIFLLRDGLAAGAQPLSIVLDGRASAPVPLQVR
ncbi:MAG: matrixin family metalloprotease [Bryobacteraceae bacterium]|nr:matrixin family metalloprotease [Bryobacteraceae bacterium]